MGRLRTNVDAPILLKKYDNFCNLSDFQIIKNKKIYLEIGCGKGDFLINQAIVNRDIYFLGIEKYSTVILKSVKKITRNKLNLKNLMFTCGDAATIDIKKFNNCFSKLYLNFSDPWPKKRHAKRRLTSNGFLDLYKQLLKNDATIEFKSDNDDLYDFSLETLKNRKDVEILYCTTDLYSELENKFNINNIQTEYEKKFVSQNKNINKIVWRFK